MAPTPPLSVSSGTDHLHPKIARKLGLRLNTSIDSSKVPFSIEYFNHQIKPSILIIVRLSLHLAKLIACFIINFGEYC